MQVDPGDTRLNNYFLEHFFKVISDKKYIGNLWSPPFFYPVKNVLAFSDNLFGSTPIYVLFRYFFSSDISFQLWMISICILCFISFVFLMRYYKISHAIAALGAFLFAFGLLRIYHVSHQQLLSQFFTPLAFLNTWIFFKKPNKQRFNLIFLFCYLQLLAGIYLGWFLVFSLAIFLIIGYLLNHKSFRKLILYWRYNYKKSIAITFFWLSLIYITFLPYINAKKEFGDRTWQEVYTGIPKITSWLSVPQGNFWYPLLSWASEDSQTVNEPNMFPGFILFLFIFICLYALVSKKKFLDTEKLLLVKICLFVFLTIFLLSTRLFSDFSLWRVIYQTVPGASIIRAVTRISTTAYFYVMVAGSVCLDSLLKSIIVKKQIYSIILSIFFIWCFLEQSIIGLPSYDKSLYAQEISEIKELINKGCQVTYVYLEPSIDPKVYYNVTNLSAMWAGIETNTPVINGYSGNAPRLYGDSAKSKTASEIFEWLSKNGKYDDRICLISRQELENPFKLSSEYLLAKTTSSSGKFNSFMVQLPLNQK
ncbi:hypothetical protein A6770_01680 [Nostoc minutum NIES-26]|uniref:Glycosyltransferase RgtA/B/C/D-like domain-containing protein n=1 Tax=Nostoc minutum NIES-26 TaxID=1844469 RepID=A0A367R0P6_9NOSO|nr:hypothetical protein A6770_01680 [Nostoc minutum NIES-26]